MPVKFPEILYGDDAKVPAIRVPKDDIMNEILYIGELKETGEFENGQPIAEYELHQFFNANAAKKKLDPETYDKIRLAFGLEKLQNAITNSSATNEKIRNNIEQIGQNKKPTEA